MSCPTCGQQMQKLGESEFYAFYHCERCGTAKRTGRGRGAVTAQFYVPKLVDRCRQLEREYMMGADTPISSEYPPLTKDWKRLGIAEAINVPDARPPAA